MNTFSENGNDFGVGPFSHFPNIKNVFSIFFETHLLLVWESRRIIKAEMGGGNLASPARGAVSRGPQQGSLLLDDTILDVVLGNVEFVKSLLRLRT